MRAGLGSARPGQPEAAARFGENLVRHRRRAGLSQEELAFRASPHRTEIGLLENGRRLPRLITLVKLARSLEASVDALLDGIEWVPPGQAARGALWVSPERPSRHRAPLGAGRVSAR